MKITAFILLVFCLHVSAKLASQTITFSGKNVSLETVFSSVKEQTGYKVLCNLELLQNAKAITIDAQNLPLKIFLERVLKGQQLSFEIKKTTIIIRDYTPTGGLNPPLGQQRFTASLLPSPPPIDIHGHVTDSLGAPLGGASVTVKGSRKGATTDAQGNFTLTGVKDNAIILISYTGFETRQIDLASNPGLKSGVDISGVPFTLTLIRSISSLDQVQIIAYGTTSQRLNTGDVTTVNAVDIEKHPVANALLALEGRVPGLFVSQTSGLPGGNVNVLIRGGTSLFSGNDPFYVVDGVPYPSQLLPNLGNVLNQNSLIGSFGSPMNFINPSDIESISVLKDAAATAIYGSRAANGAIIITTKHGKAGETRVDINLQNGFGHVGQKLDLMNTTQYLAMRKEALRNDALPIGPSDYDINGTWDTTRYTDWQKELIGRTAQYMNWNASVSGGNGTTQFLIGANFHRETNVFPWSFVNWKGAAHFNINSQSSNQKFGVQLSGNYMYDDNQLPASDLTGAAMQFAPDVPPLYTPNGKINWAPTGSGSSTFINPLAFLYNTYHNRTYNLVSDLVLSYHILPELTFRTSFGYGDLHSNELIANSILSTRPESRPVTARTASYGNNSSNNWIIEPQLSYKSALGNGKLEALVGMTINRASSHGLQLNGSGYYSDQVLGDIRSANVVKALSSIEAVYKYNAAFGRLNYNWQDKYIIDLTGRRDGSSRFGSANQFHNFGAIGLAWIFSEEKLIKAHFPAISFGKLRASYGTTGNDKIGDYQFLNLYSPLPVDVPYQGVTALIPNGLTNKFLEWESTRKLEIGAELGFLNDRILLNLSYYRNRSSNQLIGYNLPMITGFGSVGVNFPATFQNAGMEFSIHTKNIQTKDVNWSTSFNFSLQRNKLLAFPNLALSGYSYQYVIGKSINRIPVYHFLGVNPQTGLYQFDDGKKGVTTTPDTNFTATASSWVDPTPSFYGGIVNTLRYKNIELNCTFSFVKQVGTTFFYGAGQAGQFTDGLGNQPLYLMDRWQRLGQMASHQKYSTDLGIATSQSDVMQSNAAWLDASYIRLKNISLSWQIPSIWIKKFHLKQGRVYLLGENLLTFTNYIGLDPESQSSLSLPPLKVWTFGVQLEL